MEIIAHGWDEADFHRRFLPVIERMMTNRGWMMNSYAQVEFLTADLIVKSRRLPEYDAVNSKALPFGIENRVERVRELCSFGPLKAHAECILPLLDHILELEETRHLISHGFFSIHIEKGGERVGMHVRRYVPPKKGAGETRSELFILPEKMEETKEQWARFAQTAVETFRAVFEALGLESHDVTDGDPPVL